MMNFTGEFFMHPIDRERLRAVVEHSAPPWSWQYGAPRDFLPAHTLVSRPISSAKDLASISKSAQ